MPKVCRHTHAKRRFLVRFACLSKNGTFSVPRRAVFDECIVSFVRLAVRDSEEDS
jgi:hypothetical protein